MSSTNRGAERAAHDAYYTPDAVARACVATIPIHVTETAWEPHAGGGAFVRALVPRIGLRCHASDIDPRPIEALNGMTIEPVRANALDGWRSEWGGLPDWIIGNPPYAEAQEHIEMALKTARVGVAFLLRLAFLEGQKRAAFWRAHPCATVHVLTKRPSFTGSGTDSAAYGFFRWQIGHDGPTTLHHL